MWDILEDERKYAQSCQVRAAHEDTAGTAPIHLHLIIDIYYSLNGCDISNNN